MLKYIMNILNQKLFITNEVTFLKNVQTFKNVIDIMRALLLSYKYEQMGKADRENS